MQNHFVIAPPSQRRAIVLWLCDTLAAIGFAAALTMLLAPLVAGTLLWSTWLWALALLVAAGLRAWTQGQARIEGLGAAQPAVAALRARLAPRLIATAHRRQRLSGEDGQLAVDAIDRLVPYWALFRPIQRAAAVSPLLIAVAVAGASWVSALILTATLVPFTLGMIVAGTAARRESEEQLHALTRLGGLFVDRVRSLPLILSYGAQARVVRHMAESTADYAERTLRVLRIAFASSAILEFFSALAVALVAVYCGFSLLGLLPFSPPEQLDFPRAFFALSLAPEFYVGMRRLAAAYHDKQQGDAALAAIAAEVAVSAALPTVARPAAYRTEIGLTITDFSIRHGDTPIVGPLSMNWPAFGLHVIAGPSGSGKTSLLRALIGQVASDGSLSLDGADVAPVALAARVGWAGQRVLLLPDTLRANLLLPVGGEVDWRALSLLNALGLGPMVTARGGLDAELDERGSGLSGGERRRIGLARAMLSDRRMLLLDEPTADLDTVTAQQVVEILQHAAQDRLLLVATHDPVLLAAAASIVTLP